MSSSKNYIGVKYGLLTILENLETRTSGSQKLKTVKCLCDCGNVVEVCLSYIRRGRVKSCGCTRSVSLRTHSMTDTPTYKSWQAMKNRCTNPKTPAYSRYGAIGVQVCDRWLESFENFLEDMGERPEGTSLNRINNLPIYSKETCEWANLVVQAQDQRCRHTSKTGIRGVTLDRGKFAVRIVVESKRIFLGIFENFFEACCARKSADLIYWARPL